MVLNIEYVAVPGKSLPLQGAMVQELLAEAGDASKHRLAEVLLKASVSLLR